MRLLHWQTLTYTSSRLKQLDYDDCDHKDAQNREHNDFRIKIKNHVRDLKHDFKSYDLKSYPTLTTCLPHAPLYEFTCCFMNQAYFDRLCFVIVSTVLYLPIQSPWTGAMGSYNTAVTMIKRRPSTSSWNTFHGGKYRSLYYVLSLLSNISKIKSQIKSNYFHACHPLSTTFDHWLRRVLLYTPYVHDGGCFL